MDRETAIDNLVRNYGELANLDRPQLEKMFDNGLKRGLSIKQMYDGIRLVYGVNFQRPEYFSTKEAAEMLELSEDGLLEELEKQGIPAERKQGNVFYFPQGL